MNIWVVIPVFNEDKTVAGVIKKIHALIKNIIVVNDCSLDKTLKIINKLPVTVIKNDTNLGYAASLEIGLRLAFRSGADYTITIDGDGENRPVDLEKFIKVIRKYQPDFIIGKRDKKNRFMEGIIGLYTQAKYGFSDPLCGFKAYKRSFFIKYNFLERKYTIATEIIFRGMRNGASFKEVEVHSQKRIGESRFGNSIKGNLLEMKAFWNIIHLSK